MCEPGPSVRRRLTREPEDAREYRPGPQAQREQAVARAAARLAIYLETGSRPVLERAAEDVAEALAEPAQDAPGRPISRS